MGKVRKEGEVTVRETGLGREKIITCSSAWSSPLTRFKSAE